MKKCAQKNQRPNARQIIGIVILVLLGFSVIYSAWQLITLSIAPVSAEDINLRHDYVLSLLQSLVGFIVMFVPNKIDQKFNITVPDQIQIMYFVFLFSAIFLGEIRHFYYRFPIWDDVLHAFSGAMLAVVGLLLINILNKQEKLHLDLSPAFVALFAVGFAILIGVVWEIYEFTVDGLLGTNTQKYMTYDGEVLVGRAALKDTMFDLIIDLGSAGCVAILGYFSLKTKEKTEDQKQNKLGAEQHDKKRSNQ